MKTLFFLLISILMFACGKPAPEAKATPAPEAPPTEANAPAVQQKASINLYNEFTRNNGDQVNVIGHVQLFKLPDSVSGEKVLRESVLTYAYRAPAIQIKNNLEHLAATGLKLDTDLYYNSMLQAKAIYINQQMRSKNVPCVLTKRIKRSPTVIDGLKPGKYLVKFGGSGGTGYILATGVINIKGQGMEVDLDALQVNHAPRMSSMLGINVKYSEQSDKNPTNTDSYMEFLNESGKSIYDIYNK